MPLKVENISDDPAVLKAALQESRSETAQLRRLVEYLQKKAFRRSSETYTGMQPLFADGKPESDPPEVEPEKRTRSSNDGGKPVRKPLPEDTPREVIRHELPEDLLKCSCCGGELHEIGRCAASAS